VRAPESASGGRLRRAWEAPLRAHVALLALFLLVAFPLMTPDGAYTSDEGAYALQVQVLQDGGWAYEYRAAPHDPNGDFFPVVLSDEGADGRRYPYAKHPAFPLLLRAVSAVVGLVLGLHLLQLAAVVTTAAAAWLLAAEFDRSLSRPAFWLAAASPVLVNGYLIWAHAPSAAVAGLSLVAALRTAKGGLRGWPPVALAGLTAGVILRSEALLFAGAVVAALAWTMLRQHGVMTAAVTAAAVGAPPALATYLEGKWVNSIVGAATQGLGVRHGQGDAYLVGRVKGGWHELFRGDYANDTASMLTLIALVAVVVFGAMALRRHNPHGWLGRLVVPCAIAVVALGARLALAPGEPVSGLFAAWPVALLGLLLVPWRAARPAVRMLGAAGGLYLVAVLATQYPQGGGLEWGGRFLSPAITPIAVLAVLGLRDRIKMLAGADDSRRRAAFAALTAVAVASATLGLATVGWRKVTTGRLVAAVARHPADVTVTVEPSLPRLGWRLDGEIPWMHADPGEVPRLLATLREQGVHRVAALLPEDFPLDGLAYDQAEVTHEPALAALHGKLVVFGR